MCGGVLEAEGVLCCMGVSRWLECMALMVGRLLRSGNSGGGGGFLFSVNIFGGWADEEVSPGLARTIFESVADSMLLAPQGQPGELECF